MISADVARGDGTDYSAFQILNLVTAEQVAEYQGKPSPEDFIHLLISAGLEYNTALLVVENNTVGFHILEKLKEKEYPNLYWSTKSDHEYVDPIVADSMDAKKVIAGFSTTLKTRPLIIAKFEEVVRNKIVKFNSQRLLHEMETFVWNNGKAEASRGYNDDLIMATAIACWIRDIALAVNKREIEYAKALLTNISVNKTSISLRVPGEYGYDRRRDMDPMKKDILEAQDFFSWIYLK